MKILIDGIKSIMLGIILVRLTIYIWDEIDKKKK